MDLLNYDKVILFDSKENKEVLRYGNSIYNYYDKKGAYLYIEDVYFTTEIKNARKLDFNRKENFTLKDSSRYSWENVKDIYININSENITITELEEDKKEMKKGETYVYKHYEIKGLKFKFRDKEIKYLTKEEYEKLPYIQKRNFTYIDDEIEMIDKKIRNGHVVLKKHLEKLQNLKNQNMYGWIYCTVYPTDDTLYIKKFDRIEKTESRKLYEKNIDYIKNKYSIKNTYDIEKVLNDIIDLYNVDLTEFTKIKG